ncbi:unnamed protein product [Knipowitschia caucasica]
MRLRRMVALARMFQSDRPATYCKVNVVVPILRLWLDVELDTKPDFRLSRQAMHSLQCVMRRAQDHGWGNEYEVLIYVYWLAHGLSYRVVSRVFSIPRSTVHRVVHRVAQFIWNNLHRAISFPKMADIDAVSNGFAELAGTPLLNKAVGAIDGCHVRIKPPSLHRLDYLNYKGFYSIQMQAICDHTGKFLDIFVGYPGSVHDTRILKNSSFYLARRYPPSYFILGDGGYPCLEGPIALITPYREPVNGRAQRKFNYHLSRARSIVERAFGIMKTRWRSTLFRALEVKPTFAPQVIASCAFLHNVCLDNGDVLEPDSDATDILDPELPLHEAAEEYERAGTAIRDRLAVLFNEDP